MNRQIRNSISSQFPEFIRSNENYSGFIEFIEDYYDFIKVVDVVDQKNIDITDYIDKFLLEQAVGFSGLQNLTKAQLRIVAQNLIDLYKSKGSAESYKLLFNILYQKDSELFYPSTQIFKSSDAKWNRDVSVRFKITSGILNSLEGVFAQVISGSDITNINITRIQKVKDSVDIFEAFVDVNYKLIFPNGGTIQSDSFTGILVKSTNGKKIITAGTGFVVGDIYDIENSGGVGTKIKITGVTPDSGIRAFDIVQIGFGYSTPFTINVSPNTLNTIAAINNLSIKTLNASSVVTQQIDMVSNDNLNKITESVLIAKHDYTSGNYLVDNTYVGQLISNVSSDTLSATQDNTGSATISFSLGYVFEYPGYYSTNTGFSSDSSYLQDGKYYQQFSYVIKADAQYQEYENIVKTLIHPAGLKSFGEYTINKQLDIVVNIIERLSNLNTSISDSTISSEKITSKIVIKNIVNESISTLEKLAKTLTRNIQDTVTNSDVISNRVTKPVIETVSTTEPIFIKQIDKSILDTVSYFENVVRNFNKNILDTSQATDSGCVIIGDMYFLYSEMVSYNFPYWDCGYVTNETPINDTSYITVDSANSKLLVQSTKTLKSNG